MSRDKMIVELSYYDELLIFEKYPSADTVTIYNESGIEIDMFTNYDIGNNFEVFEESCREHINYMYESY